MSIVHLINYSTQVHTVLLIHPIRQHKHWCRSVAAAVAAAAAAVMRSCRQILLSTVMANAAEHPL